MAFGYNIYQANPNPTFTTYDPGFTFTSIIDLEYNNEKTSSDGTYLIPDILDAIKSTVCSYDASTQTINGQSSYYSTLTSSVSFDYGDETLGGFSSSEDWDRVSAYTTEDDYVVFSSSAKCALYTVTLNEYQKLNFTSNFLTAMYALMDADENDENSFYNFFDNFGTHYFTEQVLGGSIP